MHTAELGKKVEMNLAGIGIVRRLTSPCENTPSCVLRTSGNSNPCIIKRFVTLFTDHDCVADAITNIRVSGFAVSVEHAIDQFLGHAEQRQ